MATVREALVDLADAQADVRDEVRGYRAEVHDLVILCRADLERRGRVTEIAEADAATSNTRVQRGVDSLVAAINRTDVRIALLAIAYYLVEHVPAWLGSTP